MSERWKMNRIGFVNFWLYDEEDFEFEDGKLLLRGQNGSGKSITTQSFIPFVLDGDRTPSREAPQFQMSAAAGAAQLVAVALSALGIVGIVIYCILTQKKNPDRKVQKEAA